MPRRWFSAVGIAVIGAVLAASAGTYAGGALRPVLALGAGPMTAVAAGARIFDEPGPAGVWLGPGPAPDYVIGTGWPTEPDPGEAAVADASTADLLPDAPKPAAPVAPWPEDNRPRAPYPSEGGDILAGVGPRPPVEPARPQ